MMKFWRYIFSLALLSYWKYICILYTTFQKFGITSNNMWENHIYMKTDIIIPQNELKTIVKISRIGLMGNFIVLRGQSAPTKAQYYKRLYPREILFLIDWLGVL